MIMKHSVWRYKLIETILCLFILLSLVSCSKNNDWWKSSAKLVCDINGEAYIDNQPIFRTPDAPTTTPELWYVSKGDTSIITLFSICEPKDETKSLPEYDIAYQIFDSLIIGKKYPVTSVPDMEYLVPLNTNFYYQNNKISYATITNGSTGGICFGNGSITLTSIDHENWAHGEIELKVRAPIKDKDSLLNIKGEFNAKLEKY